MSRIIEWFKGSSAPDDYVEVTRSNPFPVGVQNELIRSGSRQGKRSLTTTPAAINVGGTSLSGRHTLIFINDSSSLFFWGFNSNVTAADGMLVPSGTAFTFHFDPNDPVEIYGVLLEGTTSIEVIEIK